MIMPETAVKDRKETIIKNIKWYMLAAAIFMAVRMAFK